MKLKRIRVRHSTEWHLPTPEATVVKVLMVAVSYSNKCDSGVSQHPSPSLRIVEPEFPLAPPLRFINHTWGVDAKDKLLALAALSRYPSLQLCYFEFMSRLNLPVGVVGIPEKPNLGGFCTGFISDTVSRLEIEFLRVAPVSFSSSEPAATRSVAPALRLRHLRFRQNTMVAAANRINTSTTPKRTPKTRPATSDPASGSGGLVSSSDNWSGFSFCLPVTIDACSASGVAPDTKFFCLVTTTVKFHWALPALFCDWHQYSPTYTQRIKREVVNQRRSKKQLSNCIKVASELHLPWFNSRTRLISSLDTFI